MAVGYSAGGVVFHNLKSGAVVRVSLPSDADVLRLAAHPTSSTLACAAASDCAFYVLHSVDGKVSD